MKRLKQRFSDFRSEFNHAIHTNHWSYTYTVIGFVAVIVAVVSFFCISTFDVTSLVGGIVVWIAILLFSISILAIIIIIVMLILIFGGKILRFFNDK